MLKRGADIMSASLLLPPLLPLFALICAAICIDSKGSPIFIQERVGKDGKHFKCLKFRTMVKDAPHSLSKAEMKTPAAYVTRVGGFLRKSSLDELPQLINVLIGDMSIVGPRPVIPGETLLGDLRAKYGVYEVRPGITGLAQVCGRDEIAPEEKAMLDRFYVGYESFGADAVICFYTVKKVLTGKNIKY